MQSTRDIEKYTQTYLEHNFEDIQVKYRAKKVLEILDQYKPKNVLEIGCGMDSLFKSYKDFEKFYVIEPSEVFAKKAIKDANGNKNITIIQDFVENTEKVLKDIEFDFVVLSCLLHEVSNPKIFLVRLSQFCNPKTILHINVPNSDSFHLLWAAESGLIKKGELTSTAKNLQQNTTFNLEKLVNIANEIDFEVIEKGSYFIKPFNHAKMSECVKLGIIDENLLDGLYKMSKYFPENCSEIFVNCRLK